MSRKKGVDKIFFWTICVLVVIGFFILASASAGLLAKSDGVNFQDAIFKQVIFGLIGLVFFFGAIKIDYHLWAKFALPIFIFSFFLTLLVFVPSIGSEYGGARRWVSLGGISFQPSELLKFGFVLYLATWAASRKLYIKNFKTGFLPFFAVTAAVGSLIIMEPDIGTLGVVVASGVALFFIAGGKITHLLIMAGVVSVIFSALVYFEPYMLKRVMVFIDPSYDPQGAGYQLRQSLIAIGSGGLFGRGFGASIQKFNYLPEPIGDSIFAVFGEEFGFTGSLFLIGVFIFFLYRGFSIALRSPDNFGRLLSTGIVIMIITQSFINVAAMIGIFPLTGLPLIFVSKGGSALIMTLFETGILLNISKHT